MLVFAQGMNVGVATLDGITPLHEACLGGHFACAKLLLEHGADVCPELPEYLLVINTSIRSVNKLLSLCMFHQANAVSVDGATPLFNACFSGNTALLRLLLKHSSVHHPAHLRNSPIHAAAKQGVFIHITTYYECFHCSYYHNTNTPTTTKKLFPQYMYRHITAWP